MRRPLNWFVVVFSLLVLGLNRMWLDPPATTAHGREAARTVRAAPGPFAYVRDDETLIYVPATGREPSASAPVFERLHAASGFAREPKAAVYLLSSPVTTTSASPSSR